MNLAADYIEIDDNGGARSGRDRRKLKTKIITLSEEPIESAETVWIAERAKDIEENWP